MKITIDASELEGLTKNNLTESIQRALSRSALIFEAAAKEKLYSYGDLGDGGEVARSIHTEVGQNEATIACSDERGFWYCYGTGAFAEKGNGRPGWWVYIDDEYPHPKSQFRVIYDQSEANKVAERLIKSGVPAQYVHVTQGNPATPFLRPALHENKEVFKEVLAQEIIKEIIEDGR